MATVQPDTGQWFEDLGATVNRLERNLVGAARDYNAETVPNNADFLSAFQASFGKGPYAAISQSYFANDESSPYAIITNLVAAQSLGKGGYTIGQYEVAINNETGSEVHTFAGAAEAHRMPGAGTTIAREFQIVNHGSNVDADPYSILTTSGRNIAITIGSGGNYTDGGTLNPATAAIVTFFDTEKFNAGWIVGENAIAPTGADNVPKIIKAPVNYALAWYSRAGAIAGTLTFDSAGTLKNGANAVPYRLEGTATYNPPNLADGTGVTTTVTVAGAALGDMALASFSLPSSGIIINAWVSAVDTVSVRFQNETGAAINLGSGTLKAWALRA